MYDSSGAWIYEVGMPAKSGVGGGVMAVLPGQLGLAVFSPKLDEHGNSVRGIAVCKRISSDFDLHMFHTGRTLAASTIKATYDAAQVPSKRTRNLAHTRLLRELGHKVMVFELQGDLTFASAEIVATEALQAAQDADYLVLDFRRTAFMNQGALNLFVDLVESLEAQGKTILLTSTWDNHAIVKTFKSWVPHIEDMSILNYEDVDHAIEWCENQLLAKHSSFTAAEVPLAAQTFCAGFTPAELRGLQALLEPRAYEKGDYLCREG